MKANQVRPTIIAACLTLESIMMAAGNAPAPPPPVQYQVSWVGNSFPGASNKWVQNFFIHTKVQPDGTVNTWSHWDEGGKKFGVYKDGEVIGNTNVSPNSLETRDQAGRLWKLDVEYTDPKHQEWEFVPKGITCDGKAVTFPELSQPMALALAKDGSLMVADSGTGPRQQVLFYDVTDLNQPKLVRTFGERGGIGSGTPGQITPTKFWGIRGLGMDAADNLYVAMSEQGSVLRSFTPDGTLRWELHGEFFCDVACADPSDDATTVWGIQERYAMDWAKPPGRDSRWVSYTLDRHKYPNDPRVNPGPFWVDQNGNIWMAYGFFRYDFQGLDEQGHPIYSADKVTVLDPPKGVNQIARVCYLDDTDTLVVAEEGSDMRHINRVFVCKGYLAGNRETVSFVPAAGKEAACVTAVGDYAFTGGWKTRGRIWVNRLSDGSELGTFDPGPTAGGVENTGWIDLLTGINAFKRSTGEYLVFVEENYKAKSLIYRWAP